MLRFILNRAVMGLLTLFVAAVVSFIIVHLMPGTPGEIALGTSGDSSCADHFISWRARSTLKLDYVPAGLGPNGVDQIAFSGPWSQPVCGDLKAHEAVVNGLPPTRKAGQ